MRQIDKAKVRGYNIYTYEALFTVDFLEKFLLFTR